MILLDTSAIVAIADERDEFHKRAIQTAERISAEATPLFTHSYAILESAAVMQRKVGIQPALDFLTEIGDSAIVHWVTQEDHERAVYRLGQRHRRNLSLVDCMSFVVMEMYECTTAFAYDSDFETEGFELVG